MRMSIDKAQSNLRNIQRYYIKADNETIDFAIDTMRKYQTMQVVLEKVWDAPACMLDKAECLDKIMETYKTVR